MLAVLLHFHQEHAHGVNLERSNQSKYSLQQQTANLKAHWEELQSSIPQIYKYLVTIKQRLN